MVHHILVGSLLILLTTSTHAGGTFLAIKGLTWGHRFEHGHTGRALLNSSSVVDMFLVSLLEALLWAYAYLRVEAVADFEAAFYFSVVTFTTLGHDVVFRPDWSILIAFEAANGIIMFGWTTAMLGVKRAAKAKREQ